MKRALLILAVLPFLGASTAPRATWGVQRVLTSAVVGERTSIARYEAFALMADAEGYFGIADLFRAESRAEQIHLARFTALMNERGMALPVEQGLPVVARSTMTNLVSAAEAESCERDDLYLDGYRTALKEKDAAVAAVFDETRSVEAVHAELCFSAVQHSEQMKQRKTFYVCSHCGYTSDTPISYCPICKGRLN